MLRSAFGLLALAAALAQPVTEPIHLVACAPGYPGNTAQAQPTMDEFARLLNAAAGWSEGRVSAEYQETEEGGVARLRQVDTGLALVPLAFFLKYEDELELRPLAQVVGPAGVATERWSLVAATDRLSGPEALAGWTVIGIPAYAPAFVRGPILRAWGGLPGNVDLQFSRRVLAAVRRAMAGEDVAVILDEAQTEALAALPDAAALQVVATSGPLLSGLVVSVGGRLDEATTAGLLEGLGRVHADAAFADLLETVRVQRFEAVDEAGLADARRAFVAVR